MGADYELSVEATGGIGTLRYVWRRNGAPIAGAEEATYRIEKADAGDEGIYDCEVSDDHMSVTSETAVVHIAASDVPAVTGLGLALLAGLAAFFLMARTRRLRQRG